MTSEECIAALHKIIDASIADNKNNAEIKSRLDSTYKESKKFIETRRQSLEYSDYWQQRFQFRQYRVKKEKDQALSRKSDAPAETLLADQQAPKAQSDEADFISKEQASRDIAAAVARVKARRDEKNK